MPAAAQTTTRQHGAAPGSEYDEHLTNIKLHPGQLDAARIVGLRPTRDVTKEEIEAFKRDGFVKLEGIMPVDAAKFLGECFDDMFFQPLEVGGSARYGRGTPMDHQAMAEEVEARGQGHTLLAEGAPGQQRTGRFLTENGCFYWHTDFKRFCAEGPLPIVVQQLLETKTLRFYNDHCFFKEAGSLLRTGFHQDSSFFQVKGDQLAVCWVSPDVVTRDSGAMCYIRGSHKGPTYAPNNLLTTKDSQTMAAKFPDRALHLPDIEGHPEQYDIVYCEAKPGDVLVHNENTIHGSAGNANTSRPRRGASIRYIGDDIFFEANPWDGRLSIQAYDPNNKLDPNNNSPQDEKANQDKLYAEMSKFNGAKLEGPRYPQVLPTREGTAKL